MEHPRWDQLHPESRKYLELLKKNGAKPYNELASIAEARELNKRATPVVCGDYDFGGKREEIIVPSSAFPRGIPAYVYTPQKCPENAPILIFFHGGGLVLCSRLSVDITCKKLCDSGNFIVVNVEYRLAPENPHPACFEDAECVTKWVLQNKIKLGGGERSAVGVIGDSGGGSLASAMAHDIPGLAFQVLVYPNLVGNDTSLPSYTEFKEGYRLTLEAVKWLTTVCWPNPEDGRDVRHATLFRDRFDHLPPTLLIVAEFDPIRDGAYEYKKKLDAAGVVCDLHLAKGALHAFYTLGGVFPTLIKEPYQKTIKFVNKWGNPT